MKLLTESSENVCPEVETSAADKKYYIKGIFMQSEVKNRNGRIYSRPILERAVRDFTSSMVQTRSALGELGHRDAADICHDRASHLIESLKWEGNDVVGKALILDTPCGKIVKSLMDAKVRIAVSSRGLGSISEDKDGNGLVDPDFSLVTVDIVSDPSAPKAFVQGVMENKEWVMVDGRAKESDINKIKQTIGKTPRRDLEAVSIKLFESFLNSLSKRTS